MKLLLYCKIDRPYLLKHDNTFSLNNFIDYSQEFENGYFTGIKNKYPIMNGKIVLECDYEIEKHTETIKDWLCMSLREKTIFGFICKKANVEELKCYRYANGKPLHAIYIKNIKLIEPRPLESTCYYDPKNNYKMIEKDYKKNHHMRIVCLGEPGNPEFVFFPVTSNELYEIITGKKTIIIRRRVLKEML